MILDLWFKFSATKNLSKESTITLGRRHCEQVAELSDEVMNLLEVLY